MIVVTGATGFIGRRLIKYISDSYSGEKILCLNYIKNNTNLEITGTKNIKDLNIQYVLVDLINKEGFNDINKYITEPINLIFHLASITDTGEPNHSINDIGTRNLLEKLLPHSQNLHFIFASTIALHDNRENYNSPISEDTPIPENIYNEYGRRKQKAVEYLKDEAVNGDFKLSIVRVTGVFGFDSRKNGLYDMVDTFAEKGSILGRINWPGKISCTFVNDMARFMLACAAKENNLKPIREYIPSTEAISMSEMCRMAYRGKGKEYNSIRVPKIVWDLLKLLARNKWIFERVLPHNLYNKFWQMCILVNNEFWNESKLKSEIINWETISFQEYYRNDRFEEN